MNPVTPQFSLGTFLDDGRAAFAALVLGEQAVPLEALREQIQRAGWSPRGPITLLDAVQQWDAAWPALRAVADSLRAAAGAPAGARPLAELRALVPLEPRQVYCSGANYKKHVVDLIVDTDAGPPELRDDKAKLRAWAERMMDDRAAKGSPYMFQKSVAAVTGPNDPIVIPASVKEPDWELELAVVIGRRARNVRRDQALQHVAGYTIANDVTARDRVFRRDELKNMGTDWTAAKSAPTFLPLGPYLVPAAFVPDPQRLQITLSLNGQVMQDESTADMIFDVARQIEFLSSLVELRPGDVICTGSPSGNGTHHGRLLRPGDVVESTITGLGSQRNPVAAEEA